MRSMRTRVMRAYENEDDDGERIHYYDDDRDAR